MSAMERRNILPAALLTLLTLLTACGGDGGAATTTTTAGATTTAAAPGAPRDVAFPTADGLTLEGRLFPAGSEWVLLAHMYPADMTSWFEFAAAAQEAGFTALAYNNRGYGGSGGTKDLIDVGADALGAIAFARANGASGVFFFGASMNGAAALFAAAEADLAGIASLSGVPAWDNTPGLERAPAVTARALFVAAEDDGDAVETARLMADAVGGSHEVVTYPTGGHGTAMFAANPGLTTLLLDFLTT